MAWRFLRVLGACGVLVALAAPACGGSSSDPHGASAGSGNAAGRSGGGGSTGRAGGPAAAGSGNAAGKDSTACGDAKCSGLVIPLANITVPGCCADEATNQCGLDSSALEMLGATLPAGCQPLAQPGTVDTSCPASPKVPLGSTGLEIAFPGCCRPDNVCGYQVDGIPGLLKIGLGCIDSAPFLDGGSPQTCGDIGAAGANGEAGSGGLIGYAGAAGDTSSGGTNGGTSGSTSGGSGGSSGSESGSGGTSGGGTGGTGG